ncbi:flavodoxin [Duganella sp. FT109W]|uniref:Flavodoxin n=2 Tax=Duganella margarita TaxID=2692170 RepID=A0ABW9WSX4_9BURK|nr:flavodoxin [Duganella margarita]MYN43400.1 flavodoxin [Duganella margarita]
MKSILIVYYSHTGVTAQVAHALARTCGADLEQITEPQPRQGVAGYLRAVWQALRQQPAPINPPRHHPADYPVVVLGTPVWAGHLSSPMRSYILQQREHFRHVALFCTMGGSGGAGVLTAMADLCNKLPMATLCVRQRDVLAERYAAALTEFVHELPTAEPAEERLAAADGATRPG